MEMNRILRAYMAIAFLMATVGFGVRLEAATVQAVSKKQLLVKIDIGEEEGFKKGATVCFFTPKNKRVGCGKVLRVKAPAAFVKVSSKTVGKIKKDFTATLKAAGDEGVAEEEGAEGATAPGKHKTNIKGGYLFSAMTPSTYNKLTYLQPVVVESGVKQEDVTADTMWKIEDKAALSIFGIYAESEFTVSSFSMAIGFRYRAYRDFIAQADYDITDVDQFIETSQSATALGLYTDFIFLDIPMGETFFWRLSTGLDIDMATMTFKATHKTNDQDGDGKTADAVGEVASATSKISIASLRLGTNFSWLVLDPMGLIVGLNVMVPLAEFGKSFSAKISDPHVVDEKYLGDDADGIDDLQTALDHKKASVGAEVIIGGYIAF